MRLFQVGMAIMLALGVLQSWRLYERYEDIHSRNRGNWRYPARSPQARSQHDSQGCTCPAPERAPHADVLEELVQQRKERRQWEAEAVSLRGVVEELRVQVAAGREALADARDELRRQEAADLAAAECEKRLGSWQKGRSPELEECQKKNDSLRKQLKSSELDNVQGKCAAHAAAARSQLQDKLLLLMGSNVVAYTSAFCGGVDVPNLANLTRFSGSRCQGEEFDIAKLDARVEEAPPATSSEQMTTQHLMKSLGEVVHILHDGNATAKSVPLAALDGLIDTVEWDLEMSASAHAVYMDALRLSAPVLLQNLTVKQTDALATSRILRRTQEVEVSFPSFFHGLPPDETEYEVPLAELGWKAAPAKPALAPPPPVDKSGRNKMTASTIPIQEALTARNFTAAPRLKFGRCALVGNAQRMLLRESGSEIDGHDVVLRLNNAPTVGFERWVGSKTHLRLVNNQWTREYGLQESLPLEINCTLLISRADAQSAATLRRVLLERRPDVWAHIFQREGTDLAGKLLRGMRVMAEPVRGMQYAGKASPSSGFLGMYFLLQLCQQVSVYGVGLGGCSGDNCRGGSSWHYWQEDTFKLSREFQGQPHHSFELEHDMLRVLDAAGHIELMAPQRASDVSQENQKLREFMPQIIEEVETRKVMRKEAADNVCLAATGFKCRPMAPPPSCSPPPSSRERAMVRADNAYRRATQLQQQQMQTSVDPASQPPRDAAAGQVFGAGSPFVAAPRSLTAGTGASLSASKGLGNQAALAGGGKSTAGIRSMGRGVGGVLDKPGGGSGGVVGAGGRDKAAGAATMGSLFALEEGGGVGARPDHVEEALSLLTQDGKRDRQQARALAHQEAAAAREARDALRAQHHAARRARGVMGGSSSKMMGSGLGHRAGTPLHISGIDPGVLFVADESESEGSLAPPPSPIGDTEAAPQYDSQQVIETGGEFDDNPSFEDDSAPEIAQDGEA